MTLQGVDFSDESIPTSVLVSHGAHFACGYVSTPGNRKNLTRQHVIERAEANIATVTIFETTAERMLSGAPAGNADAFAAQQQALELGQPLGTPIFYAGDWDYDVTQRGPVAAYFAEVKRRSTHYDVGVYGGFALVSDAWVNHWARYLFQTYAWSGGRWHEEANLRQVRNSVDWDGHQVDLCEGLTSHFGQWVTAATPTPRPAPPAAANPPNQTWTEQLVDNLPTLEQGAKDPIDGQPHVAALQALLDMAWHVGIGPTGVDGDFGAHTEVAVRQFQERKGLAVDGIVGPQTWSVLVTGHHQ